MNNNDNGYVYVLMNQSMPNLVKIGKTQRTPEERAKELSSTTGVPTPFTVVYDNYFENCSHAEQHVHILLENKGYRVSKNREFFEMPIKDAIDVVMETKNYFGEFQKNNAEEYIEENKDIEPWSDVLKIAEEYHYGYGDYIQDYNDAITYYLQAIKLGYKQGYYEIGMIYGLDLDDDKKSFEYYKKGITDGCIDCYSGLGQYYLYKDFGKAKKSYELYMKYIPTEELLYPSICNYLFLTLWAIDIDKSENKIEYFDKTLPYKNDILQGFSERNFTFYNTYKSFYDLPKIVQDGLVEYCKERAYTDYELSSYRAELKLENNFLDYLELIYKTGYMSPDDFDGEIFIIEYMEIDRII